MRNPRKSYQANSRTSELSKSNTERSNAPKLGALFPALLELRVELSFYFDARLPPINQTHILHPPASAYFKYPCPVYGCNGVFKLDMPVMRFVREHRPGTADEVNCSGVRARDRLTGKPCGTCLRFSIYALYSAPASAFTFRHLIPQPSA